MLIKYLKMQSKESCTAFTFSTGVWFAYIFCNKNDVFQCCVILYLLGTFSTVLVAKATMCVLFFFCETHSGPGFPFGVTPLWSTNKCDQVMHEESEFDEP